MKVAVIGASGFVGRRVVPALLKRSHEVLALTRSPEDYEGPGTPRLADLDDAGGLAQALSGADAAYLLAHSLGTSGFEDREAAQARALADAADRVGLSQLVYLGGLGRDGDELSPHLRSRREVERILARAATPLTVLRAGILIGAGSAGWEMLRQVHAALPVMVHDSRARARHQPIAADDAVGYLVDVLGREDCLGVTFEIGGEDVLTFADMARRLGELTQGVPTPVVELPWVPDAVAAIGVELLTDVDGQVAKDLLGSMSSDSVVTDDIATTLLPRRVLSFDEAVRRALAETSA